MLPGPRKSPFVLARCGRYNAGRLRTSGARARRATITAAVPIRVAQTLGVTMAGNVFLAACVGLFLLTTTNQLTAQVQVPGTGRQVAGAGDDFEDPAWEYIYNNPKASNELDGQNRNPAGVSKNGRFFEPAKRGQPDLIQRVATPEGGLPGSTGSMMFATLHSGVPGRPNNKTEQDDLIASMSRAGGRSRSRARQASSRASICRRSRNGSSGPATRLDFAPRAMELRRLAPGFGAAAPTKSSGPVSSCISTAAKPIGDTRKTSR